MHDPDGGTYTLVLTPEQELALQYYAERYTKEVGALPGPLDGCGAGAEVALQALVEEMLETMLLELNRLGRVIQRVLVALPPGLARQKFLRALDSPALQVYLNWVTDDPQAN